MGHLKTIEHGLDDYSFVALSKGELFFAVRDQKLCSAKILENQYFPDPKRFVNIAKDDIVMYVMTLGESTDEGPYQVLLSTYNGLCIDYACVFSTSWWRRLT